MPKVPNSGGEDSEDWPWRPSHSIFGKSTIKQSHLENMRGRYFRDMSIVRAGGDNNVLAPEEGRIVSPADDARSGQARDRLGVDRIIGNVALRRRAPLAG